MRVIIIIKSNYNNYEGFLHCISFLTGMIPEDATMNSLIKIVDTPDEVSTATVEEMNESFVDDSDIDFKNLTIDDIAVISLATGDRIIIPVSDVAQEGIDDDGFHSQMVGRNVAENITITESSFVVDDRAGREGAKYFTFKAHRAIAEGDSDGTGYMLGTSYTVKLWICPNLLKPPTINVVDYSRHAFELNLGYSFKSNGHTIKIGRNAQSKRYAELNAVDRARRSDHSWAVTFNHIGYPNEIDLAALHAKYPDMGVGLLDYDKTLVNMLNAERQGMEGRIANFGVVEFKG